MLAAYVCLNSLPFCEDLIAVLINVPECTNDPVQRIMSDPIMPRK